MSYQVFVNFVCNTNGSGLWSSAVREVQVIDLEVNAIQDEEDEGELPTFGELRVGFNTRTWSTRADGLIYTDRKFLADLRRQLEGLGFSRAAVLDIGYSEQGMQGRDYVSLDVGGKFIKAYNEKYPGKLELL